MSERIAVKRALVSVSDKTGLVEFVSRLVEAGVEIVSSGGTARTLADAGLPVVEVAEVTGSPEMLDGRVKTLHPAIHGAILADLGEPSHVDQLAEHGIVAFQLVVSNLYPFSETVASGADHDAIIEQIDIGGPAMVRAAAKNHAWVGVVTDPSQYEEVGDAVGDGGLGGELRSRLARQAFFHTATYDSAIVNWLETSTGLPERVAMTLERRETLRYGENPHQAGGRYVDPSAGSWWDSVNQHQGLPLSYLNIFDTDAAWRLAHDLGAIDDRPAVAIIKHANPCGVAVADDVATAYRRAFECDSRSAFGGIVAFSRPVDAATATAIEEAAQADVIIAPGFEDGVLERIRARRKNTRVLETTSIPEPRLSLRQISAGWLVQEPARFMTPSHQWRVVTDRQPTETELADASFAWRVCGHVSSNAIVMAAEGAAWGIGAGQQNRVEAGRIAADKAAGRAQGGAMASDAFFPFPDGIDVAVEAGVAVVVQPGGAMRDDEVIAHANKLGLAMVLTGERQFRH